MAVPKRSAAFKQRHPSCSDRRFCDLTVKAGQLPAARNRRLQPFPSRKYYITAHPLRYFNPMTCFHRWQSETLTRKQWSKSRKQLIRSRSKAKSFWNPESLSASYRKPKSALGRGCRRRRQSPGHAKLVPSARKSNKVKYDCKI
jgi:hypothetical protein